MQSSLRVAQRLHISMSLRYRYDMEFFDSREISQREWERLHAWIDSKGLNAAMNDNELAIVHAAPLTLSGKQQFDSSWAIECAGVCAWALDTYPMLRYDEAIDSIHDLASATGFLRDIPAEIRIRAEEDLVDHQTMIRTCLWRLREFDRGRTRHDLKEVISRMENMITMSADCVELIDGDLCTFGRSIDALQPDEYDEFYCSLTERFRSVNWILDEDGSDYYETEIDT